jgi:hypothetical protein
MQYDEQNLVALPIPFPGIVPSPSVAGILARLGLLEADELASSPVKHLVVFLKDHRWERRAAAATALGEKGADTLIGPLLDALRDEIGEVRAAVARALGQIRNPGAVPALITVLQDSQALVREAAVTALGKIGKPVAYGPLSAALRDGAEEVRTAAARALGRLGKVEAVPLLCQMLQDPQPLVREAAAEALGALHDIQARLVLLAHVKDEEYLVRDAVANALFLLEHPFVQDILQLLFREKEQRVQHNAKLAASLMVNLGFALHEEQASIIPLVVAGQSGDRDIEKTIMCYLMGRSLEALDGSLPLKPLLDTLYQGYQSSAIEEGIWKMVSSLVQEILQERKIANLLAVAANDSDSAVRAEIDQAVRWLLELALTLQDERGDAGPLQLILEKNDHPIYKEVVCKLLKQALDALEEREPGSFFLADLRSDDAGRNKRR